MVGDIPTKYYASLGRIRWAVVRKEKISVSVEPQLLEWVDEQVNSKRFASRSHAIEYALARLKREKGGTH